MKIKDSVIEELKSTLEEFVAEYGEKYGKYMFSNELGIIENKLYSEVKNRFKLKGLELISCAPEIYQSDVEGELPVVDEAEAVPFLDVV